MISISGNGADLGKDSRLKAQKTRSFDNIAIGALVDKLAGENGLQAATGSDYAGLVLPHVDQVNESDMNLLTRIAADHGAIFKVADGRMLFVKQGEAKTASGKAMPEVTITEDMCTPDWRVEISERTAYGAVIAQWRDGDNAALKEVKVGDGEPVFTIRKPFATEAAAKAGAQAKKDDLARGTGKATLTLAYGIPSICAETPLNLSGFDPEADGKWIAVKVSHTLSGSGLTTTIEAGPPNA